jgi:RNA-directed DNA polymerase
VSVPRPAGAKQAGEVRARWAWTEPVVWTPRMLMALERGVKGGVWFSLIDKVYGLPNLLTAFARVKANGGAAGCDHQTIAMYEADLEANLQVLSDRLRNGTYHPQKIRRVRIPKPGSRERRPLGIPTVRDRIVQTALRNVIEPIFERDFAEHSYGFRPNRGCKDALRRVDTLLQAGYTHVVDADLKSYFDTIPHQPLMDRINRKIADGRVLKLIEAFLTQKVLEGLETWTPTSGSPQGAVISPLLSNAYLDPLDHLMAGRHIEMVRYADDCAPRTRVRKRNVMRRHGWASEAPANERAGEQIGRS